MIRPKDFAYVMIGIVSLQPICILIGVLFCVTKWVQCVCLKFRENRFLYNQMLKVSHTILIILCLWFCASLICINNCPMRCNTKQSIYYTASSLYMFRVPTTPIIRSIQNCNYSLWCWSYFLCSCTLQPGQAVLCCISLDNY
jgi:hypothetical protein